MRSNISSVPERLQRDERVSIREIRAYLAERKAGNESPKANNDTAQEQVLCTKGTALELLGITARSFEKLGIEPVKTVPNPYYSKAIMHLYDRAEIESLIDTQEVVELRPKPRKPKDYTAVFARLYSSPADALGDVAEAMFNLNRYCNHASCTGENKDTIYSLKNQIIKILYQGNYATSVTLHRIFNPQRDCWCGGDDNCPKCYGSGVYLPELELKFYVFNFDVGGVKYCWHQPVENVNYPVSTTGDVSSYENNIDKAIDVPRAKLTELKALVRWYINSVLT